MDIRPKDFFGNVIKVGDCIVYPGRQGSSMWMNVGTVIAIGSKPVNMSKMTSKPVLQVKRVQHNLNNEFIGFKDVEVEILNRVICLGRGYGYGCSWKPRKSKNMPDHLKHRTTWLDRVMAWIRG